MAGRQFGVENRRKFLSGETEGRGGRQTGSVGTEEVKLNNDMVCGFSISAPDFFREPKIWILVSVLLFSTRVI